MNRRSLLRSAASSTVVLTGGTAGTTTTNISVEGETTIHIEAVSIKPGTSQRITVRATNVRMIHFASIRSPLLRGRTSEKSSISLTTIPLPSLHNQGL
jgi:hypothetical protein